MPNSILTEMRGASLIISFNRPQFENAMTMDMASRLFQILKSVPNDRAVRAVMLKGEGGNFMNGLDMGIYDKDIATGVDYKNEVLLPYHSVIRELHGMDKPVLTVVTGKVARAGLSFVLASDLVLAGTSARFNAGYTSLAMTPDGGVSFFLTRKVGVTKATEILMLNKEFDAYEAEKLNLVNDVVSDAELMDKAYDWLDILSNGPTKAYGGIKRLVGKAFELDIHSHIALEHNYWGACSRSFDFRSAIKAYFTKEPVKFTGG